MTLLQLVESLSKKEHSILFYLESRLVDQAGMFRGRVFTGEDWKLIARLENAGLFKVTQIPADAARKLNGSDCTHWVDFEDSAWLIAHELRRVLAQRVRANCQNFGLLRPVALALALAPAPRAGQPLAIAQNDPAAAHQQA